MSFFTRYAIAIALLFGLIGCDLLAENDIGVVKTDPDKLRKIVKIDVPAKSMKWEIVAVPDAGGFLSPPGPTDYLTLVAQLEGADHGWFLRLRENPGRVWIAPESARPWLSPYFKGLLTGSNADMIEKDNCKKYQEAVTKSGRIVHGFVCEHESSLLIYLTLMSPSQN